MILLRSLLRHQQTRIVHRGNLMPESIQESAPEPAVGQLDLFGAMIRIMKIAELLQSLADTRVDYVLVGGMAVQLHGFLRATVDIDLVLAMNDANLDRFIEVAKQFGLQPVIPVPIDALKNAQQIARWHREKGMLAFALREPKIGGSVIDILVRPDVSFDKLSSSAVEGKLFGRKVMIASIDDLIAMKQAANRPKDQLDIAALEKVKRGEDPNE
jgi:hypothetical protein